MLHFHALEIAEVRPETDDAVGITFRVPDELAEAYRFRQGQHLNLKTGIDGQEVRRSYSICSSVADGSLRIAVKRVEGGLFSHYANETLKAGDRLEVMTPTGRFNTSRSKALLK